MDDIRHDHPMTGDQCAICEGPVGDDAVTFEDEEGALLRVCGSCAARSHPAPIPPGSASSTGGAPAVDPPPSYATPAQALAALRDLRERRAQEHAMLTGVAALLEEVSNRSIEWQTRADTYEQHARSLEAELKRTRERLRRAEELLAAAGASEPGRALDAAPPSRSRPVPAPTDAGYPPEAPLTLEEVRLAQRYFNDSPHIEKLASVRRSLGRPAVSLVRLAGAVPRFLVTAAWEIVWYQYLIDLSAEVAEDERVAVHAEGMELDELLDHYREANASLDDKGRLDASELEVSLLSGESELITDMSAEEEQALEDATEEIWDRHTSPQFRWDD